MLLVNSNVGDHLAVKHTNTLLGQLPLGVGEASNTGSHLGEAEWGRDKEREGEGERVWIKCSKPVQQVCWHVRGDYLATVAADGKSG